MGSRRDTWLVVVLLVVIIALAALAGATADPDDSADPRASTYVRSPDGAAALYWTLQELDVPVRRRRAPFLDEDSLRGVVVILAPMSQPSAEEANAVAEHVRGGGTLLYVPSAYGTRTPLGDTLGLEAAWIGSVFADSTRAAQPRPHRWTEGLARVEGFRRAFGDTAALLRRPGTETLLTVEGKPAAITWPLGKGRVIALADAEPLRNGALRRSGAATLLVRALQDAAHGDTVWFDEYHHGFDQGGDGLVGGMLRHAARTLPAGLWVQWLAATALLLWLLGRRFGAPLPPPALRRRSPLEHVEALAGAYRQAGATRTARRLLLAGLARRLGRRAPADEAAAAEMLGRMARQSPVGREAAARLEKDFKRGGDAELVSLARGVDRYLDEVRRP
ncbi:DUF4350 domain-containing protein [Longimicrobium sp.]|uniref:DUF4350 domain-containing protein n=1 Tax=Longimicrobium sp. TaxID=2029185 RepID=UPI002E376112|nr:DUF4350 domain-containing protein [Longimicrobium sp.]HEX6040898.1 DUF4350 domain-containing protein [Longimicrobium sp.]